MSGPSKRKRQKLVELLVGSSANWSSKASHQASQLMKLNKILLVCDANFLDEKTGESPLSLSIGSQQLAQATLCSLQQQNGQTINMQSASLFSLQSQHQLTNSIDSTMLRQTNIADLYHSRAPLIERLILLLVKSGAQIDFRNSDGRTPLHVAAMKSNFWALKTLLDLGASNDYRDINGLTPLYYSILHMADLKVTQLLLNHNRSSNAGYYSIPNHLAGSSNRKLPTIGVVDQHGWQEVHQACKLGLDAHLEKLLYYGCDIDAKISGSGNTPLHVAAINDQLNCAKVLLMRGANKTITNNSHQTAHQVAVISNNMDLAEFIAEHNESKVIPFTYDIAARRSTAAPAAATTTNSTTNSSTRSSSLANSQSSISIAGHQQHQRAVLPVYPQQQHKPTMMIPLSLDVAQGAGGGGVGSSSSNASQTCSSINSSQPQSLLSIGSTNQLAIGSQQQQLNVQVNNISPCLSQRSCATSNTTSSSGVCCDVDGTNSVDDHHHHQHQHQHNVQQQQAPATPQVKLANSQSQHSNITVISINNAKTNNRGAFADEMDANVSHVEQQQQQHFADNNNDPDEEDDSRSSGSCSGGSSQELYSIMSEERPLFVGSIVEAASDYQSGDPSHLQLKRGDRIEVLEYTSDLLQAGQLPRLANKPMLFGRRLADGQSGLFPSFCVNRTKYQSVAGLRQKLPLANITAANSTINHHQQSMHMASPDQQQQPQLQQIGQNIRGNNLPESLSMASLPVNYNNNNGKPFVVQQRTVTEENPLKLKFKETQVTLIKGANEGFGFILRGAKIDPATVNGSNSGVQQNKLVIDENLMAANNLVSLQYLDDIEPGSVAQRAGLKRGDFLVAVNGQDVRLFSHEQVVQKIVQSGEQVHLAIATPVILNPSLATNITRTFSQKVKPEPPKRDPNTTLTRNKNQRAKSMLIQPISSLQRPKLLPDMFDANKPLPMAPSGDASGASPTGSLNMIGRSISAHFHSSQSLSSSAATDTQSISSVSTISADQQHHQPPTQPHNLQQHQQQIFPIQLQETTTSSLSSQQATPTHSSSSTATLTTVAAVKPTAPPKPKFNVLNNIYQPATITTSKRTSPTSSPKAVQVPPMAQVPTHSQAVPEPPPPPSSTISLLTSASAAPQPPPPPPPLPDFSAKTPELTRATLSKRRTSAPITPSLISDVNRLLKKRESLASVGNKPAAVAPATNTTAPAQFGAVAAACAAAANNRLQRRQQQHQKEQQEKVGVSGGKPARRDEVEEENGESVNTVVTDRDNLQSESTIEYEGRTVERKRPIKNEPVEQESGAKVVVEQKQINQLHHKPEVVAYNVDDNPVCVHQKQRPSIVDEPAQKQLQHHHQHHQHLSRQQASATLGRKSSAQIIQQPKQASGQLHQHSQTLRAKPTHQRPPLPHYDEMCPPPPPPLLDDSWRRSSNAEHLISEAQQQAAKLVFQRAHQHQHLNHGHNQIPLVECQQQVPLAICQPDVQVLAQQHQGRQSQELIYQQQQHQQLYLLQQQQQLIKQQRLQQQQMKLQQQQQQHHRLCLDSLPHEHHRGHAMALDHHHLQQQRRCIDAESAARGHHHHHHNHGHNHHDHHLHDHYGTQMAPQQQPAQALLVQPCVVASSARIQSAPQHQLHSQANHHSQHQVLQQQRYHLHNHHQPQQQQQHLLLQQQRNHPHHRHHQHYS